ncbi:MAG TPA: 30S ribosomal protein S17 [Candidatus Woesebacteria bacterium]|nr:30S ribosomal protein S17 [Candidatus Woesebacteria bacterium]
MKSFNGKVVSVSNPKTVSVAVSRSWKHPLYHKIINRSQRFQCHVEGFTLKAGDEVVIQEARPISKNKHFKVVEVLS